MNLESVEVARKAYAKRIIWQWSVFIIVILVFAVIIYISGQTNSSPIPYVMGFVVAFAFIVVTTFTNQAIQHNYRRAYKAYFVEQNLKKTFTDLSYNHEAGMDSAVLNLTGMVNTGNRYSSNDFTSGKYKNVDFSQADVHIEIESTDSDGNRSYTTIFKGRFLIFEFPKPFNFKLELAR